MGQSAQYLAEACRPMMDDLYMLKSGLKVPDHYTSGEVAQRQEADFDPNSYFDVFTRLHMSEGYSLDFLYFADELGGLPLVYARETTSEPYESYFDLLSTHDEEYGGERSYGSLRHRYDFVEYVQIDQSPESYFEHVILAILADQFYLYWHGLYNDTIIFCDESDMERVYDELNAFDVEFPDEVSSGLDQIDFRPSMIIGDETVSLRIVTFSKWGGFYEQIIVLDKENHTQLLDVQFNPLIEYDCGILF